MVWQHCDAMENISTQLHNHHPAPQGPPALQGIDLFAVFCMYVFSPSLPSLTLIKAGSVKASSNVHVSHAGVSFKVQWNV